MLQVLNILGFIAVVAVNALAVLLPINGRSTEELSDMYPNLFVPAGITFSIWGAIYALLFLFTLYQAWDLFGGKEDRTWFVDRTGLLYLASSLLNIGWILAWHYGRVLLSVMIMLSLLLTLIVLYLSIEEGPQSFWGRLVAKYPISVYLGWISVATIANITSLLVSTGWKGFGFSEEAWAFIMMGMAAFLAVLMRLIKGDIPYGLAVIWAFAGIAMKRLGAQPADPGLAYTALVMGAIVLISFMFSPVRSRS